MIKKFKALALDYKAETMNAPQISAIGSNELAQAMYRQARRYSVPIVISDKIVKAMSLCHIDQEVPEETYPQIALIFNKMGSGPIRGNI